MKIKNIAIKIYLKLDAFENIFTVACCLGLADTFCCFFMNFITHNLYKVAF